MKEDKNKKRVTKFFVGKSARVWFVLYALKITKPKTPHFSGVQLMYKLSVLLAGHRRRFTSTSDVEKWRALDVICPRWS